MSDENNTAVSDEADDDSLAFEYVAGTLRGPERVSFEARLRDEAGLQQKVQVWEEQLMQLQGDIEPLSPRADTWQGISDRLALDEPAIEPAGTPVTNGLFSFLNKLLWAASGAAASLVIALLVLNNSGDATTPSGVDYVAVLASDNGKPALTTLGLAQTMNVELHWQTASISEDQDYQLWAVSRRDGQIRSVAVIDDSQATRLDLSEAHWRLITDAQSLVLTLEDSGGSAIDEPSELIVARGLCVRIDPNEARG